MADLCQLADVKHWLTVQDSVTTEDSLLSRLISATSLDFLNAIRRVYLTPAASYTDQRFGNDTNEICVRRFPINSVASLTIGGNAIPASDGTTVGYYFFPTLDPEERYKIVLIGGGRFTEDVSPGVIMTYNAGYAGGTVTDELANIPANPGPYTISVAQAANFSGDSGVKFSIGNVPLVLVTANPAAGQYSVSAIGVYTFNAADTNKAVKISYTTLGVPSDVRQAVIDWVSYRYKQRQWVGQIQKQLAQGEKTDFMNVVMPLTTQAVIEKYHSDLIDHGSSSSEILARTQSAQEPGSLSLQMPLAPAPAKIGGPRSR